MSARLKRTRGAVPAQPSQECASSLSWKFWRITGLGVLLVLIALLTGWLRRHASDVERESGRFSNASDINRAAVAVKPTLSATSTAEETMDELRRVADKLATSFPDDAAALDVLAKVKFAIGDRKEALEIWRKCAQLSPNDAAPYFSAMGIIAANSGDPDEAAELFQKAIDEGSRDPQTPLLLAENLMKAGKLPEAVATLNQHIQKRSVSNIALITLGQAYLELDQCEKAKETFQAAVQAIPDSKKAHYGLARAHARLGNEALSAKEMETFAKLHNQATIEQTDEIRTFDDESSTREVALRGFIDAARRYRSHQQSGEAELLLQNAGAISADDVESRLELMTLYEQSGRNQLALEVCQQLRRIDPNNADFCMNEGVLSARLGKLDEGLSALQRAMQIDPTNPRYREVHDLIAREK